MTVLLPATLSLYFFLSRKEVGIEAVWLCCFSRFTERSHLTSVLLLVWAWTWIPRTKRKADLKKKIQISEKVEDTNTYLPEDCNVFWNGFQLIGLNARCWSWSLRHPQTWAWRFSSLKGNTKIPCLWAALFLNPQWLPSGFPPKISGLVPFHSYWNAKLSHTFLMSSWDKAAFRQPRHQLPLWACRLLIKENVEIMRVLVGKIPVGQLSPACYLYFIPWCVSYRGCETVSG